MKKMTMIIIMGFFLTGCSSMSVTTVSPDGKTTIIENFSGDAIGMISKNLEHKLVLVTTDGTFVEFIVTPPSQDDPTGAVKAIYAGGKKVYLTIPRDFQMKKDDLEALAKIIEATNGNTVSVGPTGVNTKSGK
jgi:hypothetical protein